MYKCFFNVECQIITALLNPSNQDKVIIVHSEENFTQTRMNVNVFPAQTGNHGEILVM